MNARVMKIMHGLARDQKNNGPPEDGTQQPFRETWWKHLIAGGTAGVVSRSITAPIDRLKVLAQVKGESIRLLSGLNKIAKEDGVYAWWRGNGINIVKIMPEFATKFTVYEMAKVKILEMEGELTTGKRFVAAGLAGMVSQTVIYPMELMKTRVVVQEGKDERILALLLHVVRTQGIYGLSRGYVSAMFGIMVFSGTDFTTYETVKDLIKFELGITGILPPYLTVACAITSCLAGQFVSYPLSMASATVQATDDPKVTARGVLAERYRLHGVRGLFKGALMSYTKAIPALIITYLVYEHVLWELGASMTS